MTPRQSPYFAWPGWGLIGHFLLLSLLVTAWFAVVFAGADWITAQRSLRVRIHMDWELKIPFVRPMVLGYMSIYPLFWLAPFVLRGRRELQALALTLTGVIGAGGVGFLLLPAEPAFPPHPSVERPDWLDELYEFARTVALRHNMVPSLHVALSCTCTAVYAARAGRLGKLLLWSWAGLVALSTVLIHQHHFVDVAAGFLLALAGKRFIFDRWSPPRALRTPRPSPSSDPAPPA